MCPPRKGLNTYFLNAGKTEICWILTFFFSVGFHWWGKPGLFIFIQPEPTCTQWLFVRPELQVMNPFETVSCSYSVVSKILYKNMVIFKKAVHPCFVLHFLVSFGNSVSSIILVTLHPSQLAELTSAVQGRKRQVEYDSHDCILPMISFSYDKRKWKELISGNLLFMFLGRALTMRHVDTCAQRPLHNHAEVR